MSIDNADLIKRLEDALKKIETLGCIYNNDSEGRSAVEAAKTIDSVINDLKTMVDDGK
jgi:hypothetical protein